MAEKAIGSNVENQEIPIEFKVRLDLGRSIANLARELKVGGTLQFVATKNFDLWVSDAPHEQLRHRNGIQYEDIRATGWACIQNGILGVFPYGDVSSDDRAAIRKELETII